MSRRPWVGLGFSLALHGSLLALLLLGVWRAESLPALIVDLRDGFVPAAASIRSLVREAMPARRASSPAAVPRSGTGRDEGKPAPLAPSAPSPAAAAAPPSVPPPIPEPEVAPPRLIPTPSPRAPSPPEVVAEAPPVPHVSPSPRLAAPPRETLLLPSPPGLERAEPTTPSASLATASTAAPRVHESGSSGASPPSGLSGPSGVSAASPASSSTSVSNSGAAGASGARRVSGAQVAAPTGSDAGGAGRREGPGAPGPIVLSLVPGAGSGVGAEYGPYLIALRQRIQQSLRYPPSARRRGVSGTVNVEISILANGAIGNVTLLDSSTHVVLDEAALETIRGLPRMPMPPELARPLRVRVPVVFELAVR